MPYSVRWSQLKILLRRLPLDTAGVFGPSTASLPTRRVRQVISRRFWKRYPAPVRLLARPLIRLLWLIVCPIRAIHDRPRPWRTSTLLRQIWQGWRSGIRPWDQQLTSSSVFSGLSDREAAIFWANLAKLEDRRLALNKPALSEKLAGCGLPVPTTLAILGEDQVKALRDWPWQTPVFIKLAAGSAAQGVMAVFPAAEENNLLFISDGSPLPEQVSAATARSRLAALARNGRVLIQEFLHPAEDLRTPFPGCTPELRLTTARYPGGPARVIAAFAKIQAPQAYTTTSLSGALIVPINPETGTMGLGQFLHSPGAGLTTVPWSGASLSGLHLPDYAEAVQLVEQGSTLLPSLAVIGWDVLLTDCGPVILEANSRLSSLMINLWSDATGTPSPLPPYVEAWLKAAESGALDSPS
ncbi:sugar-transfer associated ATP-grasp domain-containing protein [Novispirillum itersonii]|uniref:sugar-transfer associated ATP-grasp domain-containing protein n=1 Tax=Novispirillum itersonii TaxID=189 RepID=UPI0003672D15|nr:sugar-transfer associated ATP-grasp domain-containing protein [Novispirillum itersonii]